MSNSSKEEVQKCISSPYYFYINYIIVNDKKGTTRLNETEFNALWELLQNNQDLYLIKKRRR